MKVVRKRILKDYNKPIYDLKVKDNHNYFITKSDILVHNSGKTYTLSKIKSGSIEPRIINTDKLFPFYKDQWGEEWGEIKDKVKTLSKNQLLLYLNSMLPLAVDGTAAKPTIVLRRKSVLETMGYDTAMVFVNTSLETALKRAKERQKRTGREVKEDFIREAYEKINKLKQFYRGKFIDWIEVNNDEGELTDSVITNTFKHMLNFYNSPIVNPIGKEYKKEMIDNGWKYLSPNILSIDVIKSTASLWYKK